MKHRLAKSVALSLLSPIIIGSLLGAYYALTLNGDSITIFFNLLMSAVGGKVIKARITHAAIWELGEIASQTLNYIRFLVHCAIEKEKSE